jgi:hypothetical protein
MADVPTVKRKSEQSLKRQERHIVVNVFNYIKAKNPDMSVGWLAAETATATDTSKNTVSTYEVKLHGVRLQRPTRKGGAVVHEATVGR